MDNRDYTRRGVTIQGRYRKGTGLPTDVVVSDLSVSGCQIVDRSHILDPKAFIMIRIGSIGPIEARVAWRSGQRVGLSFVDHLYPSVLDHMLHSIDNWRGSF